MGAAEPGAWWDVRKGGERSAGVDAGVLPRTLGWSMFTPFITAAYQHFSLW